MGIQKWYSTTNSQNTVERPSAGNSMSSSMLGHFQICGHNFKNIRSTVWQRICHFSAWLFPSARGQFSDSFDFTAWFFPIERVHLRFSDNFGFHKLGISTWFFPTAGVRPTSDFMTWFFRRESPYFLPFSDFTTNFLIHYLTFIRHLRFPPDFPSKGQFSNYFWFSMLCEKLISP